MGDSQKQSSYDTQRQHSGPSVDQVYHSGSHTTYAQTIIPGGLRYTRTCFWGSRTACLTSECFFLAFSYQAVPSKTGWSLYLLPQNHSAVLPMRILFVCLFGTSLTCVLVTQLVWSGSLRSQQFHVRGPCWLLPWLFPWALPPTQAEEGWLQRKLNCETVIQKNLWKSVC